MTFSDTEMKELGRSTQINIHNTRSLIRTSQTSRTSCSWKKPSWWKNINAHTQTKVINDTGQEEKFANTGKQNFKDRPA